MDKATTNKIMTLCFFLGSALVFWVVGVLLDTAAGAFAPVARLKAMAVVQHGLPLSCAVLTFCWLQFRKKNRVFSEEVITEVSKVVWPTKKEITGMTIAVSIMLVISGIVIALFDYGSGEIVNLILQR